MRKSQTCSGASDCSHSFSWHSCSCFRNRRSFFTRAKAQGSADLESAKQMRDLSQALRSHAAHQQQLPSVCRIPRPTTRSCALPAVATRPGNRRTAQLCLFCAENESERHERHHCSHLRFRYFPLTKGNAGGFSPPKSMGLSSDCFCSEAADSRLLASISRDRIASGCAAAAGSTGGGRAAARGGFFSA
jgi:hypothetical protein